MTGGSSIFSARQGGHCRHWFASACLTIAMLSVAPSSAQEPFAGIDVKPYLIERPQVPFPLAQHLAGVESAKVVLLVDISSKGKVKVLEVVETPHEDFTRMALAFAEGCRFTPALKGGRLVDIQVKWPLLLRPGS